MSIGYAAVPAHHDYIPDALSPSHLSYYAHEQYQPTGMYYSYGSPTASEPTTGYYESDYAYDPHRHYEHSGWSTSGELHAPSPKHPSPLVEQNTAAYLQWREYPEPEPNMAAPPQMPSYPVWDVPASTIPPAHNFDVPARAPSVHSYSTPAPQKRRRDSQATLSDTKSDRKSSSAADAAVASLLERNKTLASQRKALGDPHLYVPTLPRSRAEPFVSQTRLVSNRPAFAMSASGADWAAQAAIAAAAQPEAPEPETPPITTGRIGKVPHVACNFCRTRKIACGRPADGGDAPCNQCSKRGLEDKCEYPPSSKRGQHKRPLKSAREFGEALKSY